MQPKAKPPVFKTENLSSIIKDVSFLIIDRFEKHCQESTCYEIIEESSYGLYLLTDIVSIMVDNFHEMDFINDHLGFGNLNYFLHYSKIVNSHICKYIDSYSLFGIKISRFNDLDYVSYGGKKLCNLSIAAADRIQGHIHQGVTSGTSTY